MIDVGTIYSSGHNHMIDVDTKYSTVDTIT